MSPIQILPVVDVADSDKLDDVQRRTWDTADDELIPGRFMHAMWHNGACLLGAYDGQKMVGFVFGLLGTVEGLNDRIDQVAAARLQMYSAIMGVIPEYQGQGIGYRLKLAQREFALRIGVRLVTWTYDALESRNAYFNIRKLGVFCHRYLRDYHGNLGGINQGLPTDRFFVEWWVTSNRVKGRLSSKRAPLSLEAYRSGGTVVINEGTYNSRDLLVPPDEFVRADGRMLLVEIPHDFQTIKAQDMDLALAWRMHTRELFEYYFDNNYLVTDFVLHEDDGIQHSYYLLTFGDA